MVCGSIATVRGRVTAEHLAQQLTPEVVVEVASRHLEQKLGQPIQVASRDVAGCLLRGGAFTITIQGGDVEVSGPCTKLNLADEIKRELIQHLTRSAGLLFQQQVRSALALTMGISQEVRSGDAISLTTASEPTMQIIVLPDGQIGVFIREGSFETGKAAIARLFAQLKVVGIDVTQVGQVECHIQDVLHDTVHTIQQEYE